MRNRLILLEGLPGTGKSTNSFKLYEQLIRNGKLYTKQALAFYPGIGIFGEKSIGLLGQQMIPQWTETGTIYTK